MRVRALLLTVLATVLLLVVSSPAWAAMSSLEHLGKMLYMDSNLSVPAGQSCASCHLPMAGFADPDSDSPVSEGAVSGRFGNRNSPTAAYAAMSPGFVYNATEGRYQGGQFWDGRANSLEEQAKGPFLNVLEMNNPSKASVVNKVKSSMYASLFTQVFGRNAFKNTDTAYDNIARAIAAFERTTMFNRFSSRYDAYLAGSTALTAQEESGLTSFNAKCSTCHPSGTKAAFTDFTYVNAGLPKNMLSPFLNLPPELNPLGQGYTDLGLGGRPGYEAHGGKFKVPTLRNIAVTAPYGHNGYFLSLRDMVSFMNSRAGWPAPEVSQNLDPGVGNLGLSSAQVDDVVAFLLTLTDSGMGGGMGSGGGGMGSGGGMGGMGMR